MYKISGQLSTISRNQKYFRTRENRNFATVNSTENRIVNFSMIQSFLVVCMAGLQVFVVRFFFQVSRSCGHLPIALLTVPGRSQGLRLIDTHIKDCNFTWAWVLKIGWLV